MKIKYSDHCVERLKKRRISKLRVESTIQNPDNTLKSFRSRRLLQKHFGDKILEVVTKVEGKKITIITGYYLKENA